jgi:hypothetical protein
MKLLKELTELGMNKDLNIKYIGQIYVKILHW